MNNKEERVQCQKLWAKNKYLVLSHSSKIYLEIRTYLKQEEVSPNKVSELIKQAVSLPEDKGQVTNALHHVWGYFKKYATKEEKENFFEMIEEYHNDKYKNIPIIMITSRINDIHKKKAKENGVQEYLIKPFVHSELLKHIKHYAYIKYK